MFKALWGTPAKAETPKASEKRVSVLDVSKLDISYVNNRVIGKWLQCPACCPVPRIRALLAVANTQSDNIIAHARVAQALRSKVSLCTLLTELQIVCGACSYGLSA
jgi:cell division FtsZ-interacting protein ZapD